MGCGKKNGKHVSRGRYGRKKRKKNASGSADKKRKGVENRW